MRLLLIGNSWGPVASDCVTNERFSHPPGFEPGSSELRCNVTVLLRVDASKRLKLNYSILFPNAQAIALQALVVDRLFYV